MNTIKGINFDIESMLITLKTTTMEDAFIICIIYALKYHLLFAAESFLRLKALSSWGMQLGVHWFVNSCWNAVITMHYHPGLSDIPAPDGF